MFSEFFVFERRAVKFILTRPGITLIVVGILAFLIRMVIDGVPVVGGMLSGILLVASVFFVVGGLWIFVMGRASKE